MEHCSKPSVLEYFTYFISQIFEPLHSQTELPLKGFSMDDLFKLRDMLPPSHLRLLQAHSTAHTIFLKFPRVFI